MSLILDALNKADKERHKESAPTINSAHDEPPVYGASPEKQHKMLFLGLIGCFVIILGLGFILIMDKIRSPSDESDGAAQAISANVNQNNLNQNKSSQDTPPTATVTPVSSPATQKNNTQLARTTGTSQTPAQNNTLGESTLGESNVDKSAGISTPTPTSNPQTDKYAENRKKMIAAQYEQVNRSEQSQAGNVKAPAATQVPEQKQEQDASQQEVAAIYKNQVKPTPPPQQVRATPRPTVAPVVTAPPVASKDRLAGHPDIGSVSDLPFATQKQLPTIMYREHNYPNDVMLNNKVIRKGQQIETNLYLEEILRDGIIVRYENYKFKMPRLNSWVNM